MIHPSAAPDARPLIALAMGDPAGISPELTAKALALDDVRVAARIVVVGDRRVLEAGARVAGVTLDVDWRRDTADLLAATRPAGVDLGNLDPESVQRGVATRAGGEFALANFRTCLELAHAGRVDAVCFTPFNKSAMRAAHPGYDDEIGYSLEVLGLEVPASEFNILEGLWNARVTSHIPLAAVAAQLSRERVLEAIRLADRALRDADFAPPRIAVAALNPHAGDGGNFGREEIDIIAPGDRSGARAKASPPRGRSRRIRCSCARARALSMRCHDVPRPGPDRDEAARLRSRRHADGRLSVPDLHRRARDRL